MPLSVLNIINIAKVSEYLASIDVDKGSLYSPRAIPETPKILYMERKAVEWMYDLDPTDTTLVQTSNYLYSLCRGYNLAAANIVTAGGSVVPPSHVNPATVPDPYDFIVSGSSIMVDGQSTETFNSFIDFNVLFVRNGIPQSTIDTGGSYFSWDRNTGIFTCFPAAVTGEQFQLYPV